MSKFCTRVKDSCRWRRRKEERPAEILSAALKTFSVKGFSSTKLDDVAKQAGVSKGTLYLYFESKEALFKAVVVEFVLPQIKKAEEQAENYDGSIVELMTQIVENWKANVLSTDLSAISKMMMAEASNFPELSKFYLEKVVHRTRGFIVKLIKLGIERNEFRECNAEYAAQSFTTPMIYSAIWLHSFGPFDKNYNSDDYLNTSLDIFLQGMMKRKHDEK